jgi:Smg protein
MKETVLDVLMFLFENYHDTEVHDAENQENLRDELTAAGFPVEEINHAFAWLGGLEEQRQSQPQPPLVGTPGVIRVYAPEEMSKLSTECRGFLLYLEQLGILTLESRELVIERLLAIQDDVDLERVKWVCLLVLVSQPGEEEGAWHLEDMVYAPGPFLH